MKVRSRKFWLVVLLGLAIAAVASINYFLGYQSKIVGSRSGCLAKPDIQLAINGEENQAPVIPNATIISGTIKCVYEIRSEIFGVEPMEKTFYLHEVEVVEAGPFDENISSLLDNKKGATLKVWSSERIDKFENVRVVVRGDENGSGVWIDSQ